MKKLFTIVAFILGSAICSAQSEVFDFGRLGQAAIGSTEATDYQCVGINPANLGFIPEMVEYIEVSPVNIGKYRRGRSWAVSVGEVSGALHSNAMSFSNLLNATFQFNQENFSVEEKIEAANNLAGRGVFMNADITVLGASFQSQKYGGFALTWKERVSGGFQFNESAAQLAFLGRLYSYFDSTYVRPWDQTKIGYARNPKFFSEIFDGTKISMSWTREFGLSYGKQIVNKQKLKVYAGATVRYIQGFAYLSSFVSQDEVDSAGRKKVYAYSAVTPAFDINYGKATTPSRIPGTNLEPVGSGYGIDLGTTLQLGTKVKLALSILDIGKITWDGNVFQAQDTILNGMSSEGFNSYNLFAEAQNITGEGNYFKWGGLDKTTSLLPTRLRLGFGYNISVQRDVGMDIIVPFTEFAPGSLANAMVSIGSNYRIHPWLHVQGGFTFGGSMGFNIPAGVMFSIYDGFWELGISTRDLISFAVSKNPTISLNVGLSRFKF